MKRRLQFVIGILCIAITLSLVAVSFGWYSAESGEISLEGTEVSITTADNNYYGSGTELTCEGVLTYYADGDYYSPALYESYRGQSGIGDESYILLFKSSVEIYSNTMSGYVNSCTITKPSIYDYFYEKNDSPFRVVLLTQDGDNYVEATSGNTFTYFAVIFGDGENIFPYSTKDHKGTSFNINIYLEN